MSVNEQHACLSWMAVILWAGLSAAVTAEDPDPAPIDIGNRRELFVDGFLVDRLGNAQLKLHEPRLTPLVPGTPSGHYATVIKDGELYRRYDRGGTQEKPEDPPEVTRYWESRDGVQWSAPDLGLFALEDARYPNVILVKQREVRMGVTHNFTPFLDTRPGVPDDQRFKALAGTTDTGGLFAYASGDGIHWQLLQETPVIPPPSRENATQWWEYYAFDSQNVAFWSGHEGIYVCYYRTWKTPFGCQRMVTRSTSEDFLHWTPGVPMLPVFPGEHLYTNGTHPYFRARHIYIALPTQLLPERNNSTQILFMSSRGGDRFDRTFREAFIRPGLQQKKWGDRANYAAWHVVPTGPREMSIYVRERRYVLRTDGFVSVHADYQPGELLTRPIVFSGTKLDINYSTSASGDLRFEVQDAAGHPVPGLALEDCPPIFGDEISRLVAWTSGTDLSSVAGKPVRLRVVLRDADLYAIRFVNGDEG